MSAFYDLASLVLVPSGYKASKVYAQKPLTTDGQLTFSRASTATRVNSAGLIEEVASNVPRLDYLNSSCPKLQLGPSRTNLLIRSEEINAWTIQNAAVTTNDGTAPDGQTSADLFSEDAINGIHFAERVLSTAAAGTYTFSVFIKKGTRRYAGMRAVTNGFTNRYFALLDLDTGLIVSNNTTGTGVTWTSSAVNYGNGWYRLIITGTHVSSSLTMLLSLSDSATPTYFGGCPTYQGSTSENGYFWGAMIEAGAYATSYVKTEAAAVTRLKDVASKASITSLIGQTEGTLFIDMDFTNRGEVQVFTEVSNGSAQRVLIYCVGNTIFGYANTNVVSYVQSTNERLKMAFAYKSGSFALYVNGVLKQASSAAATYGPLNNFNLGSNLTGDQTNTNPTREALLFKTRLTNAQLAELTTL